MKYKMLNRNDYKESGFTIRSLMSFMAFILLIILTYINNDLTNLTVISVIIFILGVLNILKKNRGALNIVFIFYVLCYLFHSSYFILILTGNICGNVHVFITLSEQIQIDTLKICNYFFSLFPIGMLFTKEYKKYNNNKAFITCEQCSKIGIILMSCCAIPRLYVDIKILFAYLQYGYSGSYQVYINNYIVLIANLFYIGAILSLYGFKKNETRAKRVFIITLIILFISMMSGHRVTKVGYLIILIYMYFKCVTRERKNVLVKIRNVFLCYSILVILATVGDLRDTGTFSASSFFTLYVKNFTYKLVVDQLGEFGYAAYTLGAIIEYTPSHEYGYGVNYILSWLEVFPNIGGFLTGFSDNMSFVLKLPSNYQHALGGSLIAELFYNFGILSMIVVPLIGNVITRISNCIDYVINNDGLTTKGVLSLLTAIPLILWIRSTFNEFPRAIVWFYILIYLIKVYIYKKATFSDEEKNNVLV